MIRACHHYGLISLGAKTLPIPSFNEYGLLPYGLHECTADEVRGVFGAFNASDRRPRLWRDLERYLTEVQAAGVGKYLVVDGSFVTSKPDPGDVDVLLILRDDLDLGHPVPPFEYNARSRRYVKREFGLDFYVGFENDASSQKMLEVFHQVKYQPEIFKGLLKIVL